MTPKRKGSPRENIKSGSAGFHFLCFSRGFSLAEVLIVIAILGVMAGALSLAYRQTPERAVEKEAERLSLWFANLTTISNRTGRAFLLRCPAGSGLDFIEAVWTDSMEKNIYASAYECLFIRHNHAEPDSHYSPQWGMLTPALTVRVARGPATRYVIVSRRGRVRTGSAPPL